MLVLSALVSTECSTNQIKVQGFKAFHFSALSEAVHQLIKGEIFLKNRTVLFSLSNAFIFSHFIFKPTQFK